MKIRILSWRNLLRVIALGSSILILLPLLYDYFIGVDYRIPFGCSSGPGTPPVIMGNVVLHTKWAFVPQEIIKVQARMLVYDSALELTLKEAKDLRVVFSSSFSPENWDHSDPKWKFIPWDVGGAVPLEWKESKIFEGNGQIFFREPGDFGFQIVSYTKATNYIDMKRGIVIGNTTDLLMKRTNGLLMYISIMTFLFMVYVEFFRKSSA